MLGCSEYFTTPFLTKEVDFRFGQRAFFDAKLSVYANQYNSALNNKARFLLLK